MKKETPEMQNDKVIGLKARLITKNEKKTIFFSFKSKFSQGYDGCGTHTHK